ncbi:MAG: putative secreted protein [Klenkia sp.]|nr:putative secreted protein [Klenkia sp.]
MTTLEVLAVVAAVVLVAVVVALLLKQRRRSRLQETFGPEYDRTVQRADGRRDAERELAERAERRQSLDIRPLPRADRLQYADRWRDTQEAFVDRPGADDDPAADDDAEHPVQLVGQLVVGQQFLLGRPPGRTATGRSPREHSVTARPALPRAARAATPGSLTLRPTTTATTLPGPHARAAREDLR